MPGKIVHFEVPAKDGARARSFWGGLFGWQFENAMPQADYHMVQVAPDQAGAVFEAEKPGSGIVVYYDTDDIDASVARVRELGGEADGKAPVPGHGWFAACKDTEGNLFSLWQADTSATLPPQ
jgi:predicted enzyme related to lactoylglutathione lyase